MALFYLIRHGEPTYDNLMEYGFYGFGRNLAPLTEEGRKQAEITAKDARLIGKKYESSPNWGEWWENNWFATLEAMPALPMNGDAYIGAVHIVDGMPEFWIGMLFSQDTEVPEGFEFVDMESLTYAMCYLQDKEGSSDFYTMDTHNMCLEEIKAQGLKRKEDDWCFERYNCPRFTTPDENGDVVLDYGIAIEG